MSDFDDFDDLDFNMPESHEARRAYRAQVSTVSAAIAGRGRFQVRDISALGLALQSTCDVFANGEHFELDLFVEDSLYISGLVAHIVRCNAGGLVACAFESLDRRQEALLDKLVLEVQKRLIAERKAVQSRNEETRETTRELGADERS